MQKEKDVISRKRTPPSGAFTARISGWWKNIKNVWALANVKMVFVLAKRSGIQESDFTHRKKHDFEIGVVFYIYECNKNDELLRTDTLNTDTEEDSVVIYKYDNNGNQLATVNRYEIPSDKKDSVYIDIDVTLGDNRLNENEVNHYNALNQLTRTLTK